MFDTHVCLVSAQPTPNLTPLMDKRLTPKRVILVVSNGMQERAQWLEDVIKPRGIAVEYCFIDDPFDIEGLQQRLLEYCESEGLQEGSEQWALNLTGGTKLMSIAAYEVFNLYQQAMFYVHPEKDRLIWMDPVNKEKQGSLDLQDRIKLKTYFQAYGVQPVGAFSRNVANAHDLNAAAALVQGLGTYKKSLGTLNFYAGSAERTLQSKPIKRYDDGLNHLIDLFEREGYLTHEHGRLVFPNEAARFFVNGGWIESHVFDVIRQLRKDDCPIQDVAYGLNVSREGVPNELDVAFLSNNRLYLIECKTKKFRGSDDEDSAGAEALYKLDSLRDVMGGLKAKAMLVSFQDMAGYDRSRGDSLQVEICAGEQIRHLKSRLLTWIRGR